MDGVTLVQDDRDAVADRGRVARQLGDVADYRGRDAGAAVGLRELGVPAQRVDEVAGEMGAVGRGQRGALLALEVLMQDDLAVAAAKDQVDARPLEIAVEQQMGIGIMMASDGACVETLSTWELPDDERWPGCDSSPEPISPPESGPRPPDPNLPA